MYGQTDSTKILVADLRIVLIRDRSIARLAKCVKMDKKKRVGSREKR